MEVIRFKSEFTVQWMLLAIILNLSCQTEKRRPLRIAVAANHSYVIDTLIKVFERKANTKCDVILGPSARLMTQITQGAPYDVFLSADKRYTDRLHDKNLTLEPSQKYITGRLLLLSRKAEVLELKQLKNTSIKKIALPNPEIAPYGFAGREALAHANVWNLIKEKIVYGESVSQTNQFYLSGNAEVAITSSSILYGPKGVRDNIRRDSQKILDAQVQHYGVVVKHEKTHEKAQDFFSFILSQEGQAIFNKYGYLSLN